MTLLVMADANWGIGAGSDQQVYIPADLKRFQQLTTGHTVILGRKTLATFPGGRPLKNRENIILSTGADIPGATVLGSVAQVLTAAAEDSFVIGGASVYSQLEPFCDTALVTRLSAEFPADCHFPDLDKSPHWQETAREGPFSHEGVDYYYVSYRRK